MILVSNSDATEAEF